jgi:hypothetical protein
MPVMGLQVLHLSSSSLGLLFTSMGAGSVEEWASEGLFTSVQPKGEKSIALTAELLAA